MSDSGYSDPVGDLLAAWDEDDREAADRLHALLPDTLHTEPPQPDLDQAMTRLRSGIAAHHPSYAPFVAAWDEQDDELDDEDRWLEAMASTLQPQVVTGADGVDGLGVAVLDSTDWLAAVVGLVHAGPGTDAGPARLVELIRTSDVVEADLDQQEAALVEQAFAALVPRWQTLGALDDDRRLTGLGAWGLPHALLETWGGCGDSGPRTASELLAVGATAALLDWQRAPEEWDPKLYADAAAMLQVLTLSSSAAEVVADDQWQPFLERVLTETADRPDSAGPAWLLAHRAEWAGDAAGQSRWLTAALAADPRHVPSLLDAAAEAGDRGDAARARDLMRRAGVPAADPEYATYLTFAQPPTSGPARNAPCPCGSGRKFKLCCGVRAGHPLPARAPWLRDKVVRFALRPPQQETLMAWALLSREGEELPGPAVVALATGDLIVQDAALWEGGLLASFLSVRGPLLPADELSLAQQWQTSRRSAYEVVSISRGTGLSVRDLTSDEVLEVRDRSVSREVGVGDLLLARVLDTGAGQMFGLVGGVPQSQRTHLVDAVSSEQVSDLFAWVADVRRESSRALTEGR